jgi:hypothetical protein
MYPFAQVSGHEAPEVLSGLDTELVCAAAFSMAYRARALKIISSGRAF